MPIPGMVIYNFVLAGCHTESIANSLAFKCLREPLPFPFLFLISSPLFHSIPRYPPLLFIAPLLTLSIFPFLFFFHNFFLEH